MGLVRSSPRMCRDESNKPATSDGSMRTTTSGSTESTTTMIRNGARHRAWVICVTPEAAVTEKELVEFCFVHLGNCKRPGKVWLRHDPLPKTPVGKIKRKELREALLVGRERAGCRELMGTRCRVGEDESRG